MTRLMLLAITIAILSVFTTCRASEPIELSLCTRTEKGVNEAKVAWNPHETAIVICDMWDGHWCPSATARVGELAPFMNRVIQAARERGVLIVHSPSDTIDFYEGTPARKLAQEAPKASNLPEGIEEWCKLDRSREGESLPIDDSDGGCDCDPAPNKVHQRKWTRQHPALEILPGDTLSDRGGEIWNLFEARGIKNVILMGVHANMCVLGRPFGIRNLVHAGKNVVLMRDLTDTQYNPSRRPYVSHYRGTQLVVEHIERYWCPTITSTALTGEAPFKFKEDVTPTVAIVVAEPLYQTAKTLPIFARDVLEQEQGFKTIIVGEDPNDPSRFDRFDRVKEADVILLSVRRRALQPGEMKVLRDHFKAGKPLVAIRTASHAFDARGKAPPGTEEWKNFDAEVLGGNYHNHHQEGPLNSVSVVKENESHPLLFGLKTPFTSKGSLYKTGPLRAGTTAILMGEIPGQTAEPVAWTHVFGPSRAFYTSLGAPTDFEDPAFTRLLANSVRWALGQNMGYDSEVGSEFSGKTRQ